MMLCSEAIRKGISMVPPVKDRGQWWEFENGVACGACAIATAHHAIGKVGQLGFYTTWEYLGFSLKEKDSTLNLFLYHQASTLFIDGYSRLEVADFLLG